MYKMHEMFVWLDQGEIITINRLDVSANYTIYLLVEVRLQLKIIMAAVMVLTQFPFTVLWLWSITNRGCINSGCFEGTHTSTKDGLGGQSTPLPIAFGSHSCRCAGG